MAGGGSMGHREQMQKMADDYVEVARQMERAFGYGFGWSNANEYAMMQQQAASRLRTWGDPQPQQTYRRPDEYGPFRPVQRLPAFSEATFNVSPFSAESEAWWKLIDRLGNYVLMLAGALAVYAFLPPLWWLLRSWGWSFR